MSSSLLRIASDAFWKPVVDQVRGAIVFLDSQAAECLHWSGGIALLLDASVLAIKKFSSFEGGSEHHSKAVFVISSPLCERTLKVIEDVVSNSRFNHCVVVSSADFLFHAVSHDGEVLEADVSGFADRPFEQLERQLLIWMGNTNCKARVMYVPIFMACLCSFCFVTPPFADLFPPMSNLFLKLKIEATARLFAKGERRSLESLTDLSYICLPSDLRLRIRQLVLNLHSLLEFLDAKEDIYNIGYFSRIVAIELDQLNQARNRRKAATKKVSLMLVDRTLDLAQATSYDFETLCDRIQHLLPKIETNMSDVAVDISPLCTSKNNSSATVFGSLAGHPRGKHSMIFDSLFGCKSKEFIMELNRHFMDAVSKLNLGDKSATKPGRVNVETLESHISKFRNRPIELVECAVLLQHGLAAVQGMCHVGSSKLDTLLGIEKALLQTLAESEPSFSISRLVPIVKDRKIRGFSFEDVLILVVRVFVLAGEKILKMGIKDDGNLLKAVLADAMLADVAELPVYLQELIGDEGNELSVHAAIEEIFAVMHAVAASGEHLKSYRHLLKPGSDVLPASYSPLLKQIFECSYDSSKSDLDLECRSSGLKDRLKSGFGLFMNVNKPRPTDNTTILVYIIGGTTPTEVRRIRETILSLNPNAQVTVGSTRISMPKDTLQMLFQRNTF